MTQNGRTSARGITHSDIYNVFVGGRRVPVRYAIPVAIASPTTASPNTPMTTQMPHGTAAGRNGAGERVGAGVGAGAGDTMEAPFKSDARSIPVPMVL